MSEANAARKDARFSCLLPRREGCSPRMEEPEQRVAGASLAYEARRAAVRNALASPTSIRTRAPVLVPMPGMEVRILDSGCSSSSSSIRFSSSPR